ncbi:MAG: hypothetical protein WAK55_00820, partial [Xanthobacteraceae bacterium]
MEDTTTHTDANLHYAVQLVHATCCLAGSASYLDDIRADLGDCGITRAITDHDTPALFDWLVDLLSYQGISDSVAAGYIAQHGNARWADIADGLSRPPSCPKLAGYWRFYDCRYHKGSGTCAELGHIDACPLPRHPLRNGRLNQMAYSLFLFMRDVADNDFVGWIDSQLGTVNSQNPDRLAALREALIGALRNVYGVSDKVLAMALSTLLLAAPRRPLWTEVGATFVAVDTLVHNFLHRTGILRRLSADHPYGDRCYRPGGCAEDLHLLPANIDARQFNPAFPATFPRFVQSAIWRYCAENGLDVCNGNRIDDGTRCDNRQCQLFGRCDRIALHTE